MSNLISNQNASTVESLINEVDKNEESVELSSLSRNLRREIERRVSTETREKIKNYYKSVEKGLKNTYIDEDNNLCFIKLTEKTKTPISFLSLWNGYGAGKRYDPTAPQQRRDKQHPAEARKQILLSFIGGEDLGKFILLEKEDGSFWIIDGRQRSSIVNEFLTDKLILTATNAENFWKWFVNDRYLYSESLNSEDRIKSNKIIKTFESGKTPRVLFSALPSVIQDFILYNISVQSVVITPSVYKLGDDLTKVDESRWDYDEIMSSITRKFIDINQFHKAIEKKDIIWGAKSDSVRLVRDFLEDKPILGHRFGYTLVDKVENGFCSLDDTNEVRKFMILISRACMIYQNTLQWGAGESEIVKLILNTDNADFTSETKHVWKQWKKVIDNKMMGGTYYQDGNETMLFIPEEFSKSNSDIMKLTYFLSSLYLIDIMFKDNYGATNGYFAQGEPTKKMYKLLEKVSVYLTLGKLGNINHENWNREDLPLVKYDLAQDFYSNEIFNKIEIGTLLGKVKDLNQHQRGLSKDYENTLRTLIKFCETKI